jgi:superfamily I DNA/RNA helicase
MLLKPDLVAECLRSGPKPELRQFSSPKVEAEFTREEIRRLFLEGYRADQIAVLCRRRSGVKSLTAALQGLGVNVDTFHAFKGIEFDVVFLSQMDECMLDRNGQSDEQVSEERRLIYMAMTRARDRLYLSTCGPWPQLLEPAMEHGDLSLAA